jgi:hypothetical protein
MKSQPQDYYGIYDEIFENLDNSDKLIVFFLQNEVL